MLDKIKTVLNYVYLPNNNNIHDNNTTVRHTELDNTAVSPTDQINIDNDKVTNRKITKEDPTLQLNRDLYYCVSVTRCGGSTKELIQKGASLKQYLNSKYCDHPIRIAIEKGDIDLLKFFLEQGFDPNSVIYAHGVSSLSFVLDSLSWRIFEKDLVKKIVDLLLEYGADVNYCSGTEDSPLYCAIKSGHYEVFQLLIDKGAEINSFINDDGDPSIEFIEALDKRNNQLYVIKLICCGAIIKNECNVLDGFNRYNDEYKEKIYKLFKNHGIETDKDIDKLNIHSKIKESLKNKLFPKT